MRTWRDRARKDDPNAWYDVDGVWPTKRATYETAHFLTGTNYAAASSSDTVMAFAASTLSGRREYVTDSTHVWEWNGTGFTDRTGGLTVGAMPMMAQYGDVTICVMGATVATAKSTGANFSALAGAPNGEVIVVQSNAVLVFNTNTSADGWAASDVGDYTNWTTGESASGRLIATPGPITAAVPFGNDVLAFKSDSIYRMRYVGGVVKWTTELIHTGIGCAYLGLSTSFYSKYQIAAGTNIVLFAGYYDFATSNPTSYIYAFDGVSAPYRVNEETTVLEGQIRYNPQTDVFTILAGLFNRAAYYYCHTTKCWGKWQTGGTLQTAMLQGALSAIEAAGSNHQKSNTPVFYERTTANNIKRWVNSTPPGDTVGTCYLQTTMVGSPEKKTTFTRLTPALIRRRDLGSDSATLELTLFRELQDASAQTTRSGIAEATNRQRFDLLGGTATDNFARFKVTYTALDVEVDDFIVKTAPEGEE